MECTFGKNVKEIRKEKNLSQRELAELIGFKSVASVCKYEQSNEVPRRKVAQKFADALGVDVESLFAPTIPYEAVDINIPELSNPISADDTKKIPTTDSNDKALASSDDDAMLISLLMKDLSSEHKKEIYELIVKYHAIDTISREDK